MSTSNYIPNSFKNYRIEYSYEIGGEIVTHSYLTRAHADEDALQNAYDELLVTEYPRFEMHIAEITEYSGQKPE